MYARDSLTPFLFQADMSDEDGVLQLEKAFELAKLKRDMRCYYQQVSYKDFYDYAGALEHYVKHASTLGGKPDVVVLAAAVSDYLVTNYVDGKIHSNEELQIALTPAEKLISKVKEWNPDCRLVGFKLMVDSTDSTLIAAAHESLIKNGCEVVVANDLADMEDGNHRIILVDKDKESIFKSTDDPNYLARVVAERIIWG